MNDLMRKYPPDDVCRFFCRKDDNTYLPVHKDFRLCGNLKIEGFVDHWNEVLGGIIKDGTEEEKTERIKNKLNERIKNADHLRLALNASLTMRRYNTELARARVYSGIPLDLWDKALTKWLDDKLTGADSNDVTKMLKKILDKWERGGNTTLQALDASSWYAAILKRFNSNVANDVKKVLANTDWKLSMLDVGDPKITSGGGDQRQKWMFQCEYTSKELEKKVGKKLHQLVVWSQRITELPRLLKLQGLDVVSVQTIYQVNEDRHIYALEKMDGSIIDFNFDQGGEPMCWDMEGGFRRLYVTLMAIHAKDMTHGDIAPRNILFRRLPDGRTVFKFCDLELIGSAGNLEEKKEKDLIGLLKGIWEVWNGGIWKSSISNEMKKIFGMTFPDIGIKTFTMEYLALKKKIETEIFPRWKQLLPDLSMATYTREELYRFPGNWTIIFPTRRELNRLLLESEEFPVLDDIEDSNGGLPRSVRDFKEYMEENGKRFTNFHVMLRPPEGNQ